MRACTGRRTTMAAIQIKTRTFLLSTMTSPHYAGGSRPTSPYPVAAAASSGATLSSEDDLRRQLVAALQSLTRREPLEPTYKRLLTGGLVTRRSPVLPKDKVYKRLGSRLRERVESYLAVMQGKDPFDRISQRQPLEEAAMRGAFTLREAKEYEQNALLEAILAAKEVDPARKRHMEGIALGLQSRKDKKLRTGTAASSTFASIMGAGGDGSRPRTPVSASEQTEHARQKAELERQRAQARKREDARRRREDEERRRKEEELTKERKKAAETPQQQLHKAIEPVFKRLWDMEFVNLGGTNPFRIVIDRDNCASIGAADYFDVITTPMNLTYIKQKVNNLEYTSFQSFFADVDLMINNALLYNSDPHNPYRIAAEDMKKRHQKIVKRVYQQLEQKRAAAQQK